MVFELVFDKKTIKEMNKLPKKVKERIFLKLIESKKDPFNFFERLSGRLDYKARVGDYRIIADIKRDKNRIQVLRVGHRKNIYEKI